MFFRYCRRGGGAAHSHKTDFEVEGGNGLAVVFLGGMESSTAQKSLSGSSVGHFVARFCFFSRTHLRSSSTMADASSDGSSNSDSDDGEGSSGEFVPSQSPFKEPAKKKKKNGGNAESDAPADVSGNAGSDAEADGDVGSSDEDINQPVPADVALRDSVLLLSRG